MTFFLNKIEKPLFYLLLFCIPFQTRKILWYSGWRFNEWQSIGIYATDILLGLLLLFWMFNFFYAKRHVAGSKYYGKEKSILHTKYYTLQSPSFYLFLFLIFSAISIKNSSNFAISWFEWFKLVEFIIFFFYLKNYAINNFGFTRSLFAIFYGGLFQGVIATIQYVKQSSLGLRYLGESILGLDIKGIASFYDVYGDRIIRAYGTTPHPNIVAAYLFLALFAFYFIWFYKRANYDKVLLCGHLLSLWGFFLTFSRTAIFILGLNYLICGGLLFFKFKDLKSKKIWDLVIYTGFIMALFAVLYWPQIISRIQVSGEDDAIKLRNFYNKESVQMLSLTGTGIGDFVNELTVRSPMLPNYLVQPVHNIYLLVYSETGVFGISAFILFLIFLIKDFLVRTKLERLHHYSLLLLLSSLLFMGFFDHFLWSLQQGRFVLWLVLASLTINENDDIM